MAQANPFDQFDGGAVSGPAPDFQYKGPQAAADLSKTQADITNTAASTARTNIAAQVDAAGLPYAGQIAAAQASKAAADAEAARQKAAQAAAADATRATALAGYRGHQQLDQLIADMEAKFKAGPGATTPGSLSSLEDFLPLTSNRVFNDAGNAARGQVIQALGFTGGQTNTPQEAAAAVGPYLPQASDTDAQILDKIQRLKDLSGRARDTAVAQLGGVPDANGRVAPVSLAGTGTAMPASGGGSGSGPIPPNGLPPGWQGPSGPAGGVPSIATGATRREDLPQVNAAINAGIRSGASNEQINATIQALGGNPADPAQLDAARDYLRKNPGYKGSFGNAQREVPTNLYNQVSASPFGAGAIAAGNAAVAGALPSVAGIGSAITGGDYSTARDAARARLDGIAAARPGATLAGDVVGGALPVLGLEAGAARLGLGRFAAPAAESAYGAVSGYNQNGLTGAVTNAVAAPLTGMFGRALQRGVGNAIRGVRNADVQALNAAGVPLTIGQTVGNGGIVGNTIKGIEDRLSGIPVVGDAVRARRLEGFQGFNQAAFDQGLAPIGATTNGLTGEAGIDAARAARSRAYSDVLDPVTLTADQPFMQDYGAAVQAGRQLPADMANRAEFTLRRAGENFDPQTGQLGGRDYQQAIRRFRREAGNNASLPNGYDFGQVMGQGEDAFTGLLGRQSPDTIPAYNAANAANRNVEVLRDAVNRGRNGTRVGEPGYFAPSQLADAAAANARRFGNSAGTTNQPFFDLTRAGQRVLPSSVPDSGTAGRLAVLALPSLLGGAGIGAGAASGDAKAGGTAGLLAGALLAAGGSRTAQRALTRALIERPDFLVNLGDRVVTNPRIGGMFGSQLGLVAANQLPQSR